MKKNKELDFDSELEIAKRLEINDDYVIEDRTVYILGEIDDESYRFIKILRAMDYVKKPIKIVLSSPGGSEMVGMAIYDTIMNLQSHVTIEGYGDVASSAAIILQAADKRLLSQNCSLMIHDGSFESIEGHIDTAKVRVLYDTLNKNNDRSYKILANRSGKTLDTIKEWCHNEKNFTAREAVKANLADKII